MVFINWLNCESHLPRVARPTTYLIHNQGKQTMKSILATVMTTALVLIGAAAGAPDRADVTATQSQTNRVQHPNDTCYGCW